MGVSAAETAKKHEEILDKSIRLFRQDGLNVSVGEVMKAAGLTHGPFYNHFSSKEALIVEALTRAMDRGSAELEEYPKTERGRRDYLDTYLSTTHASDLKGGCTIAALAVEVAREPAIAKAFTEKLKETIATFSEHFPWARGKRQARGLAIHAFSSMVGAVILARAVDDPVFAREILDETRKRIS
jgi:TetR/AcrR family transcriptional repressor of nem operon